MSNPAFTDIAAKYSSFEQVAKALADMSKDRRRKVGAIALGDGFEIRSTGYNGFPRKVNDHVESRHQKPEKLMWTVHAEENVIANAARFGASLLGCTMLVTELFPCSTCARMMINAGIKRVVAPKPEADRPDSRWVAEAKISHQMFAEAGVQVIYLQE